MNVGSIRGSRNQLQVAARNAAIFGLATTCPPDSVASKELRGDHHERIAPTGHTDSFSHLGLEPFYCQPGIEGAHEKGGVEGQIGR